MTTGISRLLDEWDALVSTLQAPTDSSVAPGPSVDQVPVTVIGGFLGAGKTTLLRTLLQTEHGLRLAVVVNDIGAVNIDAALIEHTDGERIELSNGCSCCTLGPDLARSLTGLTRQPRRPDAIVIEASGVGDPTGIATVVAGEAALRLDGIITVVDAASFEARRAEPALEPLIRRQLDAAHLIALAKPDLVTADRLDDVVGQIAVLAPGRPIIPVELGRLDPAIVLAAASHGARPAPAPGPATNLAFATSVLELPTPVVRGDLVATIEGFDGVLRAKGFVQLADAPGRQHLVQVVGRAWSIEDWGSPADPEIVGQLVVISLTSN